MNLNAGSLGGCFPRLDSKRLEILSILINDECNLNCRHCYLSEYKDKSLRFSEWIKVFTGIFKDLSPSILCIAGKEPFFDSKSVTLWSSIIELRNHIQSSASRRTKIGLITNGMLINEFSDSILRTPPDYIDVSVDGIPEIHDQIRGAGTFDAMAPNLLWLSKKLPDRIWLTHTLFNNNIDKLPSFLEYFAREFRVYHFAVGFYREVPNSDNSLSLVGHLTKFINAIKSIEHIKVNHPIKVILELGFDQLNETAALMKIVGDSFKNNWGSKTIRLGKYITLKINYSSIPTGLWHSVRLSSSGGWISSEDMMLAREYSNRAVTNLRQCGLNAKNAYLIGLKHLLRNEKYKRIDSSISRFKSNKSSASTFIF